METTTYLSLELSASNATGCMCVHALLRIIMVPQNSRSSAASWQTLALYPITADNLAPKARAEGRQLTWAWLAGACQAGEGQLATSIIGPTGSIGQTLRCQRLSVSACSSAQGLEPAA
jgi:hypothetical protein